MESISQQFIVNSPKASGFAILIIISTLKIQKTCVLDNIFCVLDYYHNSTIELYSELWSRCLSIINSKYLHSNIEVVVFNDFDMN